MQKTLKICYTVIASQQTGSSAFTIHSFRKHKALLQEFDRVKVREAANNQHCVPSRTWCEGDMPHTVIQLSITNKTSLKMAHG